MSEAISSSTPLPMMPYRSSLLSVIDSIPETSGAKVVVIDGDGVETVRGDGDAPLTVVFEVCRKTSAGAHPNSPANI